MAHRGKERALGTVGILRGVARLLRLAVQPSVVDRDGRLLGQPDEQLQIAVRVELARDRPPYGHPADHLVMRHERRDHEPIELVGVRPGQDPDTRIAHDVVDVFGLAGLEDAADHALPERQGVGLDLFGDRAPTDDRFERTPVRLDEIDGARFDPQAG